MTITKQLMLCALVAIWVMAPTFSNSAEKILDYGFEDWTGDANTTPGYVFGSGYSTYWNTHLASTEVVSEAGSWRPHSGNYFFYRQFWTGGHDPVLGGTSESVNDHGNLGDNYAHGHGNTVNLANQTTNEIFVKFWFIGNQNFGTMCGGSNNKWVRIYTDEEAVYAHMSEGGGVNLYDRDGDAWGPRISWPGGDPFGDGQWHSFALYANLDNNGSSQGIIKVWLDTDESETPTYEDDAHSWSGATAFDHMCIQQNFSSLVPGESTTIGIDDIEIWNGLPDSAASSPATPPTPRAWIE